MGNIAQELESLGVTDYEITTASLEAGSVTIRHHLRSHEAALEAEPVLELGDWTGWLWSREESESGGGPRTVTLIYRDAVGYLDAIPLVLTVKDLYPNDEDETRLVPAERILDVCAEAASEAGVEITFSGLEGRNVLTVFSGGSGSIWSTLLAVLRWLPDVRSRVSGKTVELYSISSGGFAATGSVDLAGCTDGVLTVGSMSVDLAELYDAWSERVDWESQRSVIVANALVCCPEAATSVEGTVLCFTARLSGSAGNDTDLSCTSAGAVVTPFSGGVDADTGEQPEPITYDAVTSRSVTTSMDNIAPPVVAARGGQSFEIPAGANIYQPGAIVYQVPYDSNNSNPVEILPWQEVSGSKLPSGWQIVDGTKINMWQTVVNPSQWRKFWQGFSATRLVGKIDLSCVAYGTPIVEILPLTDAYPTNEEEDDDIDDGSVNDERNEPPANYVEFDSSTPYFYVLKTGQFPASSNSRDNVSDLHFCQATIKQFVWINGIYSGSATKKEMSDFFAGTARDNTGKIRRYVCLTIDTILIDRKRVRFRIGTNQLGNNQSVEFKPDYYGVLLDYYTASRAQDAEDVQMTLHGVTGYTPGTTPLESVFSAIGYSFSAGSATWNAATNTLRVTNSRREILGIDDLLSRQQIGWQMRQNNLVNNQQLNEQAEAESDWPMVSPSINVSTSISTDWRSLAPFQVYIDDDTQHHMINGGPLPTPSGLVQAEPTDIEEKWAPGMQFSVKAQWDRTTGTWIPKIICRQKSS